MGLLRQIRALLLLSDWAAVAGWTARAANSVPLPRWLLAWLHLCEMTKLRP